VGARIEAPSPWQRDRRYVLLEECEQLWAANQSFDHQDVGLPHDWHLNRARVPVSPPPTAGPKLDAQIRRRIQNLPKTL
jgi:hypothetical protein